MTISICKDQQHFIMDWNQQPTWLHLLFQTECREQMSKLTSRLRGEPALLFLSKGHVYK